MTTTSTYGLDPNLATFADEAVERAGIDPQVVTANHISSIRRSAGYILSMWSNRGHRQWTFEQDVHTVTAAENTFTLPSGTIDVQTMVLRRSGVDTEMYPISREDYLIIHDKNLTGRPDRYFVDRRRDTEAGTLVQVSYWLAAENNSDQIVTNVYKQIQDPGNAQNTMDIPFRFHEAFVSELAARIAQKYKPARYQELKVVAELMFTEANLEDRDASPLIITPSYERLYGRR